MLEGFGQLKSSACFLRLSKLIRPKGRVKGQGAACRRTPSSCKAHSLRAEARRYTMQAEQAADTALGGETCVASTFARSIRALNCCSKPGTTSLPSSSQMGHLVKMTCAKRRPEIAWSTAIMASTCSTK